MRIEALHIESTPPIQHFDVQGLSDLVVIGGPNGVGKTRLLTRIVQFFRKPQASPSFYLRIYATVPEERESWQKDTLDTSDASDCRLLTPTLQRNRRRTKWRSGVLNFESDRTIRSVEPLQFTWDLADPEEEDLSWDITLGGLQQRWQDTAHAIFKLVETRRKRIADRHEELLKRGETTMPLYLTDPLQSFIDVFDQLLRPKKFLRADLRRQQIFYTSNGEELDISTLSSGEREVVNIAFDFLLRQPQDCVVFFDEPELHLHPELSQKLVHTLRSIGARNQFILCTHSPDLIASSLDNTVVFLGPAGSSGINQAVAVEEDDQTNSALRRLGHSIGIVSLGRRIVLIEGYDTSLDKKVYNAIVKDDFPEFVLVPSEGKDIITSFSALHEIGGTLTFAWAVSPGKLLF